MTAETDIAAISDGGLNPASDVRTALTSVLARADLATSVSVYPSVAQTGITTAVAVAFDSEEWDDAGWHDTVTNNSRISPGAAGRYHVEGIIGVDNAQVNQRHIYEIRINGSTAPNRRRVFADFVVGASEFSRSFAAIIELPTDTDYFEVWVQRIGASSFDVKAGQDFTCIQFSTV